MIFDDFLHPETFAALRDYADSAEFVDEVNEADGVSYPLICKTIPTAIAAEILANLHAYGKRKPENVTMFMRLSPEGVPVPHQAHHDGVMGDYSLMLYLNRSEHCQGGTELLTHKETGLVAGDGNNAAIIERDQNNAEAWESSGLCDMVPNRAFLFESHLVHRAAPVGGFGSDQRDARLVLTVFFI